ncbi:MULTISPECIES: glycosyltransferase [unclassified Psychrobacter]|uniref:glycosyltransferase n=1 Tax=unclassified Psychrobacter TaxID=196806 RepID=UPI00293D45DE|nr:glycosyltransferase [uncultured Psychrobacter sp.]
MKPQSKIAVLVIKCLQGGGAERVVLTLGQGFYELGFEVHIVRIRPRIEYELNPNLNYHLLRNRFKPFRLIPGEERRDKVYAQVLDHYISNKIGHPDIILSNLDRADSILSYSKLPNIIYVIHNTLSLLHKFGQTALAKQTQERFVEIYSKHPCACVSQGVEKDFLHNFGDITPTTAIYNPIDRDNIQKQANAFVPDHQNYIIHVGSFKEAKRHDVLLKAYAKTDQSIPLLLLGQGKLQSEIKALVTELGLEDKVVFLGFQENPFPYIKHAQFMVLTSEWEGFALVIAEALALDTAVISTDCPSGPSELLPEGNLMPVNDVDVIAKTLMQAMSHPDQFHATFDESLLPDSIAQQYLDFVDSTNAVGSSSC